MQLSEIEFGNAKPIEGYGPDFYRLGGQTHPAPVLIYGDEVHTWGGYKDSAALLALAAGSMCCWLAPVHISRICRKVCARNWTRRALVQR